MQTVEVSDSQIKLFRRCARRWGYIKILKIEPDEPKDNLIFGDAFHTAAEHYIPNRDLKTATDMALAKVEKGKPENLDFQRTVLPAMIYGWARYWVPKYDQEFETLHCEESFSVMLNDIVNMRGKIDLTARKRATGGKVILDYKTSSAAYSNDLTANLQTNQQLSLYSSQERRRHGAWPEEVGLVFCKKPRSKDPILAAKQLMEDASLYEDKRVQVTPAFAQFALAVEHSMALYGQMMHQYRDLFSRMGLEAFDFIPASYEDCTMYGEKCGFFPGCATCKPLHKTTILTSPKAP